MSAVIAKKTSALSRSKYFTLQLPRASSSIKIHYLDIHTKSLSRPLVVFFTGFGEQDEETLYRASRPFVSKGFSTIVVALPFHKMSPENASWLISEGLRDFLRHVAPSQPIILAGTSRGAAIAACATKLASNCGGLVMILPLGLSQLTTNAYIRRAFWDNLIGLSFLDKAARKTFRTIIYEAWHHAKNPGGLTGAFRLAMAQTENVMSSLKAFDLSTKKLAVFVGKKDRIFTMKECSHALGQILGEAGERSIVPIDGGHSTVGSRLGQAQLQNVAQWLAIQYPVR